MHDIPNMKPMIKPTASKVSLTDCSKVSGAKTYIRPSVHPFLLLQQSVSRGTDQRSQLQGIHLSKVVRPWGCPWPAPEGIGGIFWGQREIKSMIPESAMKRRELD